MTFQLTVVKTLWVMKKSHQDIETSISLLCTRVKDPDINYWVKNRQVLQFLNQTIWDDRLIAADNLYMLLTYVYTSYAMHDNMRGHNGCCMMFGWSDMQNHSKRS